jgi:hypothetical protein
MKSSLWNPRLPPVGSIPVSLSRIAISAGRLEVPDIQREMGKARARLDMVHVQNRALLCAASADHASVAVFEKRSVTQFLPFPCIQKLPARRMREMTGIGPPKSNVLDEVVHSDTREVRQSDIHYLINRSAPSARSRKRLQGTSPAMFVPRQVYGYSRDTCKNRTQATAQYPFPSQRQCQLAC